MARHHGYRHCIECGIRCTPMNFVDVEAGRTCLACWTARHNPDHPEMEAIIEKVESEVKIWRCQKHTRDENGLPTGPQSYRPR